MKFSVNGRIWIESGKGVYSGSGRIALLERIKKFGSITEAARSMKMSYRQAWEQIDSMNKQSKKPLVVKVSGGAGGGGTRLTKEGENMISLFNNIQKEFKLFLKSRSVKLK